jgi:uncharacterized membrane protein YGL010W
MHQSLLARIKWRHRQDLKVYRGAHQEWRNRIIHYLMIPVECFAFQLCIRLFAGHPTSYVVGLSMAALSMTVATKPYSGTASFLFHTASCWFADLLVLRYEFKTMVHLFASSWTAAWAAQVCIGHYLLEKNSPNVANPSEVSFLAMGLSVLISWSS